MATYQIDVDMDLSEFDTKEIIEELIYRTDKGDISDEKLISILKTAFPKKNILILNKKLGFFEQEKFNFFIENIEKINITIEQLESFL